MRVFKRSYTVPIPPGAKKVKRKGIRYAKYEHKGRTVEERLTKNGDKIIKESKNYYIAFEDNLQLLHTIKAFTQRDASQRLADNLQTLLNYRGTKTPIDSEILNFFEQLPSVIRDEIVAIGLLDEVKAKKTMELETLISDYESWLNSARHTHGFIRSEKHRQVALSRIRKIVKNCGFVNWGDIQAKTIEKYIGKLERKPATYNGYALMFKGFCNWVVDDGRAEISPVAGKKLKLLYDPKESDKRAFTQDEIVRLLESTAKAPYRHDMTGIDRACFFLLAAETGLRAGALLSLTVGDFDFQGCRIIPQQKEIKNRLTHIVYLKPERARQLKEYFKGKLPGVKAFKTLKNPRTADMVREDLEETEIRNAAGEVVVPAIPFLDSNGKKACFHSFKRTFVTTIINITHDKILTDRIVGNKPPRGDMAAHYRDITEEQIRSVIEQLPDYQWPEKREALAATGTDGKTVDKILRFSCSGASGRNNFVEQRGVTLKGESKPQSQKGDIAPESIVENTGYCLLPVKGKDEKSAETGQKQTFTQSGEKILPKSCFSDPELRKIIEIWPSLPKHIKSAIKAIVQAHEAGRGE